MNRIILLDASPLEMISNPSATHANLKYHKLIFDFAKMTYNIIKSED